MANNLGKQAGAISLAKGEKVSIQKTASMQVERIEKYSKPGSEDRPSFLVEPKLYEFGYISWPKHGELIMDAGSRNLYKHTN